MRMLPGVWAVLLWVSAAMVCGADGPADRVMLSRQEASALTAGLSPSARRSLAGTITPREQLTAIQTQPAMARQLRRLRLSGSGGKPDDPAWMTGITLTPLEATYPADGDYMNFSLALTTRAAYLSQVTPLPTAAQEPPLLWLYVPSSNTPLLSIEAKWPMRGAYLITFVLKDVWAASVARPRVHVNGVMQQVYADSEVGCDRWTVVCLAEDAQSLYHTITVYPAEIGFTLCCLSKVVVSKVWLE
ncbi:MAG: hypothetical protein ACOX9R_04275 [Armatimonadota bacterium]